MSYHATKASFADEIVGIKEAGLWKTERVITSDQKSDITLADGSNVINMCANNYLGLANHPAVKKAASDSLDTWGFGLASVRFICGTQGIHKTLENRVSGFLGMEDTILYAAAFDANGGVFEPLLSKEDAIVSDSLNHASIIDGVRLCKAYVSYFRLAFSAHSLSYVFVFGGRSVRMFVVFVCVRMFSYFGAQRFGLCFG